MWIQIIETMYAQQVMLNKINTLMDLQRMKHWYIDENYKSQPVHVTHICKHAQIVNSYKTTYCVY